MSQNYEVNNYSSLDDEDSIANSAVLDVKTSPLERLRARTAKSLLKEKRHYINPNIEGMVITANPEIRVEQIRSWQRKSQIRDSNGQKIIDQVGFSTSVLTSQIVEIRLDGELLKESGGAPMRLTSPSFIQAIGLDPEIAEPRAILETVFGGDAEIMRFADQVVSDAGYGDDEVDTVQLGNDEER